MTTRNTETILRTYGFWILSSLRDECREFLETNTLRELIESPGNLRSTALFRDQADGTVEVVILALWDSMESVKAFLGKQDLHKPRIDPTVHAKIFDREPYVRQYSLSDPDALALIPPSWR
ncbi:hypothetical protein QTH90_29435 [Variovorax sp. J2P1-59]|uniref:hypothetical protein n=1 Tax=Variovorax flavidus TaxID=3053501 RepID=UPI002577037D|nr:hypothetical protein [Variovorax sp. J2P1-59]MDM0078562.1 hypothetical protein [Variovorax sp. J2P1-59]